MLSNKYQDVFGFGGGPFHDACTVSYLIDPSIFNFKHVRLDIETKGECTYGMTSVDILGITNKGPNVCFAYQLKQDKFWNLFDSVLRSYSN
ncbi:nucleoside hydrolase [Oceanobacillus halotolerans]|uniref:nucleoside hydrolase n=1 Tax=Oceanobacillus halotolerans TaxID=2663380 RepID=UPI00299E6D9E|nr:nucleoside hydrolase [Oceanobacillus halotolerans]